MQLGSHSNLGGNEKYQQRSAIDAQVLRCERDDKKYSASSSTTFLAEIAVLIELFVVLSKGEETAYQYG